MKDETRKQALFSQGASLKKYPQRVYLNEHLTKHDAGILKKALQDKKAGVLHSVSTFQGKIYGKTREKGKPFCLSESKKLNLTWCGSAQPSTEPVDFVCGSVQPIMEPDVQSVVLSNSS